MNIDLNTMSKEQLVAYIATLKKAASSKLSMKVSDKGALSVYGMGRFPVTLYRGQWERLLAAKDEIESFISANADKLTTKGE